MLHHQTYVPLESAHSKLLQNVRTPFDTYRQLLKSITLHANHETSTHTNHQHTGLQQSTLSQNLSKLLNNALSACQELMPNVCKRSINSTNGAMSSPSEQYHRGRARETVEWSLEQETAAPLATASAREDKTVTVPKPTIHLPQVYISYWNQWSA